MGVQVLTLTGPDLSQHPPPGALRDTQTRIQATAGLVDRATPMQPNISGGSHVFRNRMDNGIAAQ